MIRRPNSPSSRSTRTSAGSDTSASRRRASGSTRTWPGSWSNTRSTFIGIDYAIDNRVAEERIFPLARDRGIAVMVYLPFGRRRMWQRIGDRGLPEWTSEFGVSTWAQFMLKFVVAHPAVTVAVPGTGDLDHMMDNLGGGRGRLPNEEQLQRMIGLVESLPEA